MHSDKIATNAVTRSFYFEQVVAVGTPITRRPPRRSVQAVLPHTALTLDSGGKRYSPHIAQSVGHANSRTVSGTCPWRISAHAAIGVWYSPRQCGCQR